MAALPYRNDALIVLQEVEELKEKVDKVDKKFDKLLSILSEVLESMTKPVYGVQTEFKKETKKNGKKDKAYIQ